jgi:hypothetical protein
MIQRLLLLLVGVCASLPVMSQGAPVHSAVTNRVAPERFAEWQDLRRQLVDIYKKAGRERSQLVYSSLSGPLEYVIVQQYPKWESLAPAQQDPKLKDFAGELAGLNSRLLRCVEIYSRDLGRVSELSYGMKEEPAPMVRVIRTTLKPGVAAEYMNLMKTEVVPAYKKAGVKTFVLITPGYGDGAVSTVNPTSWKDIDEGNVLLKALGRDGLTALMKKLDALIVKRQVDLYQYRPGLSYRAGAAGTPSGSK